MRRVLVTGAAGFIGSHVVEACVGLGYHVVGLDKQDREWPVQPTEKVITTLGTDHDEYFHAFPISFDVCFHLAAESRIQPSFDTPELYLRSNVVGTQTILEMARACGGRVVYAGSSTADDKTRKNIYATTKRQGEMLCECYNTAFRVPVDIARFYNVYGDRQIESGRYATVIGIWLRQLREGQSLTVTGDGRQRRDFTSVQDIVQGLLAIADNGSRRGDVYSLGSGTNYSILEVAQALSDNIEFIPRPRGEASVTLADISKAFNLGWSPNDTLMDYLASQKAEIEEGTGVHS